MLLEFPLPMPVLETQRLRLRRFEQQDLGAALAWACDEEVFRYAFSDAPRGPEDVQAFLDSCSRQYAERGIGPWAVELRDTREQIGNCSFSGIDSTHARVEINYFFGRRYWGQGFATEATREMLRFGFEALHANRMEARCLPGNTGSERVLQKLGMAFEGLFRECVYAKGRFHDLKVYSILHRDWLAGRSGGSP